MADDIPAPHLSLRSGHLREASLLRALTLKVSAFQDGINLGQGVCDLDMPRELRLGAVESIFRDRATYTSYAGVKELREQIVRRNKARYGLEYGLDDIVTTTGSSGALTATLMTLADPLDELILFEPFYPYHYTGARLAGLTVKTVSIDPATGAIDWDTFRSVLNARTRMVLVNTPSNPAGKVWTRDEINVLAEALDGHPAIVVTDEIYEDLVYEGAEHVPPATHPALYPKTVTISGLSKAFSITGWRIGWLAAPAALSRAIGPVFDVMNVCAARPLQMAAATALRDLPETYFAGVREAYAERRKLFLAGLSEGGFSPRAPRGAYYVLADYTERYGAIDPVEACFKLLDECHIAAIPGTLFYAQNPPPYLRFQFAVEAPVLEEVARRLRRG